MKAKRLFRPGLLLLCTCLLTILLAPPAAAQQARRTVRVGFFAFDGYHCVAEDGTRSGYGYEYLQHLRTYTNWDYEYVGYEKSWSDMLRMLDDGEIDLLTSAVKTPEREEKYLYSDEPIGTSAARLAVKAGSGRYSVGDYAGWDGIRVGMLTDSTRNAAFAAFAAQKSFRYTAAYYGTAGEIEAALDAGEIDALLSSGLRRSDGEWTLAQFDPEPIYIITRRDRQDLMDQVNYALEQVNAATPNLADELQHKYYGSDSGAAIAFTPQESSFIRQSQADGTAFCAVINPDETPYAYLDPDSGQMKGIWADICREIFRRAGLTVRIETPATEEEYRQLIKDDSVAIRCDAFESASAAEQSGWLLTSPYYSVSVARLYRRSYSGAVHSAAVVQDGPMTLLSPQQLGEDTELLPCASVAACRQAVTSGRADAAYLLNNTAQALVWADEANRLNCVTIPTVQLDVSLAVRADQNYLLVSVLDKAAASITDVNVSTISAPYTLNGVKKQTLTALLYEQPLLAAAGAAVLLVLLFLAVLAAAARRRQQEEQRANEVLTEAVAATQSANTAKTDFLSRMSHDMRTPLNGIIGMAHIAASQPNPPDTEDCLAKIDTSAHFLLGLINDILDMTKAEGGKITLHPEPYPMVELNRYIDSVIQPLCSGKNQTLEIETQPVENVIPIIDILRCNQILFNLLSNAVKYTPEGGRIALHITNDLIPGHHEHIRIVVSDNGIGMSEEFQKILFRPFTQEGRDDSSADRGSGLGLSIVKKMVDLMDGTITVKSSPGEGSVFTVDLAFDYIEADQHTWQRTADAADGAVPLKGRRVLLCEDHPLNQEIARRLLEENGVSVDLADNGQVGVEKFSRAPVGFYDAVLMDIRMPVMDGYAATRAIRALRRPDAASTPILSMTADVFAADIAKCREAGMDGYIAKPIEPDRLRSALCGAIAAAEQQKREKSGPQKAL